MKVNYTYDGRKRRAMRHFECIDHQTLDWVEGKSGITGQIGMANKRI